MMRTGLTGQLCARAGGAVAGKASKAARQSTIFDAMASPSGVDRADAALPQVPRAADLAVVGDSGEPRFFFSEVGHAPKRERLRLQLGVGLGVDRAVDRL